MFCHGKLIAIIGTALFVTALPVTAMASTSTKINSVSISIVSDIKIGSEDSDVEVTTGSDKYCVDNVSVLFEPEDEWSAGDQPILEVKLKANDDYSFSSGISKKDVRISGSKGDVSFADTSRNNSSELEVTVILDVLKDDVSNYELDICGLEWDESHGIVRWDVAGDAIEYQVRLYRGCVAQSPILTTKNTSYDFSGYITKSGSYSYKVRAISFPTIKGKWEKSDSWHETAKEAEKISSSSSYGPVKSNSSGSWLKDDRGWWYSNADKSYTVNSWQYINDEWYYFNALGYMVTGWVNWDTKWYYCGRDGAMDTNRETPDGYYVGIDGAWTGE